MTGLVSLPGWLLLAAGPLLLAAGPLLLWGAWRRSAIPRRVQNRLRVRGWLSIVAAIVALSAGFGVARGAALALALLPVPGLLIVGLTRQRRSRTKIMPLRADSRRGATSPVGLGGRNRRWLRTTARVLPAGPLAAAVALVFGALAGSLFTPLASGIASAIGVAVVLWAAGMAWSTTDPRLRRPALGLVAAQLFGALLLSVTP